MQTTGPASPEQPPAVDLAEVEVKVGVGPRAKEEAVVKADVEDEEGEQEEEEGGRGARRQRRRRGGGAGDGGAVVMVKRELLARCMTCPLCRRLLRDATTISECLHTCESFLLSLACSAAPADPGGLERSVRRVLWELPATEIRFGSLLVLGAAPDLVVRGPGTWVGAVGVDSFPAIRKRCAAFWASMRDCDSRLCRKCINKKINDEDLDHCPVCKIDLGCTPAEKLRDGSIPASSIQKYIMQKLSLPSESEVEISCCGQSVNPTQPVRNLVERWLRVGPVRPLQTLIGSSGGDYVMVISYGRPRSS
nr:unnamed protein product [Digitaria exilis]